MDNRQIRRQLLQNRNRGRLIIDEDAPFASECNLPPQDQCAVVGFIESVRVQHLLATLPGGPFDFEDG